MLKDEIEQRFVNLLKKGGVTHEQMELIVQADPECKHGPRLQPFVKLFADEAKATIESLKLESVPA